MSRKALIAGNWKMHKTGEEAAADAGKLLQLLGGRNTAEVMVAPAFTSLAQVAATLRGSDIALGAQNLHWEKQGAFTGEISPGMLTAAGCGYVIIGHSERRQLFGETDDDVNRKIMAAVEAGLAPVMCIGETETQRDAGDTFSVLDKQVRSGLENQIADNLGDLVLAYEPVWAIGTGKTATAEQAQEAHGFVRSLLVEILGADFAQAVRILYGGSVKPANIAELMAMADIDGALVGGASLDPETFSRIALYNLE
jgi:triosephosphate isomerase